MEIVTELNAIGCIHLINLTLSLTYLIDSFVFPIGKKERKERKNIIIKDLTGLADHFIPVTKPSWTSKEYET